jgi:hypothetical protein
MAPDGAEVNDFFAWAAVHGATARDATRAHIEPYRACEDESLFSPEADE